MEKILVVDNDKEVRELVEVTLAAPGRRVLHAESGKMAIEMTLDQKPDLIIMDIVMPGEINGIEATRFIKKRQETKDVKIILLTAKVDPSFKKQGAEAGADNFFLKPFSPRELKEKVERTLNNFPDA
ncbi:MAG: response regulator [Nitrospinae bacterium]|nr:response regulator [Nitrospinota bacterium]